MSALGGILSLYGAPVPRDAAVRIGRGLAQIGPDGEAWHHERRLSLVYRPFHVSAADRRTTQPWTSPDGMVVAWNGRLDNAAELRDELSLPNAEVPELIVAAYRERSEDCVADLVGDFSLALWDPERRRLLLATDPFALRPLFFHHGSDYLFFASRARTLVEAAGLSTDLDDVGVAAFLTFLDAGSRTVLRDVQMLPPAHRLTVEEGVVRLERYWTPAGAAPVRHGCDADYEEHFAHVFRRAVADRLVADAPVWADLSGGLDSSSIVCVADRILAERHDSGLAPRLDTVSYVYARNRSCDEREYIQAVEAQRGRNGRRGLYLSDDEVPTLTPIPWDLAPDLPTGQLPFHNRYRVQHDVMRGQGARVLLRGSGGDHVLWGEVPAAFELADLLSEGRPAEMLQRARTWARVRREPLFKTVWQGGVWPLLPRSLRATTGFAHRVDDWFDPDFVRRADLKDRLLGQDSLGVDDPGRDGGGFALPSQRLQWAWIAGVGRYAGWELPLSDGCVEARFPFLDRRLVELAMALPTEQKLRPGETRSILRRALRGVLPETVRRRTSKSGPDEAVYRGLTREAEWLRTLFDDAHICRHGFVRAELLERAVSAARHGVMLNSPQLLRAMSLEFWIRSLGDAPSASSPTFERDPRGFARKPSAPEPPGSSFETPNQTSAPVPGSTTTAAFRGTSEVRP